MSAEAPIVLEARGITRAFPGVQALADVELTLRAGEVHALMGQNGAGKSTLIKVLTGVQAPDTGSIELLGQPVTPRSPLHAQELGISAVHQESHLLPNLSVAENICAGRYPHRQRRRAARARGLRRPRPVEEARRTLPDRRRIRRSVARRARHRSATRRRHVGQRRHRALTWT